MGKAIKIQISEVCSFKYIQLQETCYFLYEVTSARSSEQQKCSTNQQFDNVKVITAYWNQKERQKEQMDIEKSSEIHHQKNNINPLNNIKEKQVSSKIIVRKKEKRCINECPSLHCKAKQFIRSLSVRYSQCLSGPLIHSTFIQ